MAPALLIFMFYIPSAFLEPDGSLATFVSSRTSKLPARLDFCGAGVSPAILLRTMEKPPAGRRRY
jgi:hypothetical protein